MLCYLARDMLSKGLIQAYEMQDFAHETAMACREALKDTLTLKLRAPNKDEAAIIGTLGKVWKDAQEQIRIHRGKPLPGSLTHEKIGSKRGKRKLGGGVSSMFADYVASAAGAASEAANDMAANAPTQPNDASGAAPNV